LIEFARPPANLPAFERRLDEGLRQLNIYYDDLITGSILEPLRVVPLPRGAFRDYMRSLGKLGGQNKVPRLADDRRVAEGLLGGE
ncbi:MAG: GH3 auxin-responsive promoter family protein, partial [Catalinimonas sp.]